MPNWAVVIRMRVFSTSQSIADGEPSVASIIETLVAIAVSAGIAIRYNTLTHIAVGACVAPFLLLRSQESVALGARWFQHAAPTNSSEVFLVITWRYLRLIIYSYGIRVLATLRHPIKGIQNIPSNWVRVVLCTDIEAPIELVPGAGTVDDAVRIYVNERYRCVSDIVSEYMGFLLMGFAFVLYGLLATSALSLK